MTREEILETLETGFPESQVAVDDLTGTGDHFQVLIVSESFEGMSSIERHRLVYDTLGKDVGGAIHALSIQAFTPEQWEQNKSRF